MSWLRHLTRSDKSGSLAGSTSKALNDNTVPQSVGITPPLFNEISAFWFDHRNGDGVPDWADFSPLAHTKFLPHIALWEVIDGDYLARVTGETVSKLFPVKVSNNRLSDVLTEEIAALPLALDRALASNGPVYENQPNAWRLDDETVHSQAIHLPFRADGNDTNRILSVFSFTTELTLDV